MAYYSSDYHEVPYAYESYRVGYDSTPIQSSLAYSTSDYNYGSSTPYDDYGSSGGSILSYCASTSSVPKFLQHSPALTQFVVSYSTAEFSEPEFQDYDPTPYGGGYDLVATYGKPLPPSDQTCYRRSATDPPAPPSQGSEIKVKEAPRKDEIKEPDPDPGQSQAQKPGPAHETPAIVTKKSEPTQLSDGGDNGSGYNYPEPERPQAKKPDSGKSEPTQLSVGGDHNVSGHYYPWGEDGNETQSGYGFESSALGYSCPCCCHANSHRGYCIGRGERQPNWWANYIFGCSAYPYGQGRELGGNYPNPIFGYERHYQEQSLQGYVQYEEPSLLNTSNNFF